MSRNRLRKRSWPAVLAGFLAATVAGSVFAAPVHAATNDTATRSDPRTVAHQQAVATGKPVAVAALTTATSTTTANPNGTYTTTTTVLPTRMKVGNAWRSIDATLKRESDGTITTTATPNRLTLSGGGHGTLVTVADDAGHRLGLSLPATLPAPSLSGPAATYRNVYPGVDLVVTAQDTGGFRQVFTVHDAAAAALAKHIRLTTTLTGLTLRSDSSGNLSAVDSVTGRPVLTSPPAAMWDSATTDNPAANTPDTGAKARSSTQDGPGSGAHAAPLPVSVDGSGLSIAGDVGGLGTGRPTYPVYLDPTWTLPYQSGGTQAYTQVQSGCPTYTYFNNVSQPGVGYNDFESCVGAFRSYFQIDTSNVINPAFIIQSATLKINEVFSAWNSCNQGSETITIYTTAPINSGTDWNNKPGTGTNITSKNLGSVGNAAGTMCSGGTVAGDFNVLGGINQARANNWPNWTFTMVGNETAGSHSLERFNNNPSITTVYDVAPNMPTNTAASPAPVNPDGTVAQGCDGNITGHLGISNLGGQNVATLSATLTSPVAAAQMYGHFEFYDHTTSTEWFMNSGGYVGSGGTVSVQTPALTDGHLYTWQVNANDQFYNSTTAHYCGFVVDETAPTNPVVTSTDFPAAGSGQTGKTSGQSGAFTLSSADPAPSGGAASGLRGYLYSLDTPLAASGNQLTAGTGTISIAETPASWGTHTLYAEAVDNAGNVSGETQYTFYVPWNASATTTPGDLTGDGVPDLLSTTATGSLVEYRGDADPSVAPAVLSDTAHSPDGQSNGWNKYLLTHRGSFTNQSVDDVWAYDTANHHLYLYKNSGGNPFENTANVVDVTKADVALDTSGSTAIPACNVTQTADCSGYDATDWDSLTQVLGVGDLYGGATPSKLDVTGTNDLLTVEGDALWLYQGQNSNYYLNNPIKLGTTGWSGVTLLAPGLVGGTPTLWARDNATGTVYSYPITFDASGYPVSLGARTTIDATARQIATGYSAAAVPAIASPGDTSGDGNPDLYSTDATGHLWFTPGTAGGGLAANHSLVGSFGTATEGWGLADSTCAHTADSATGTHDASVNGTVTCGTPVTDSNGVTKPAFGFNGTNGYLATAGPVLNTAGSFTVSAWVRIANTSGWHTAVSQDGVTNSAFFLQYSAADGKWALAMDTTDADGPGAVRALSTGAPAVNVWTHLTGVYDASAGKLSLYVNGVLQNTVSYSTAWASHGALAIGRALYAGAKTDYFPGQISDVRVSDTALTAAQISAVYSDTAQITQLS
jgi:hypothetical protein